MKKLLVVLITALFSLGSFSAGAATLHKKAHHKHHHKVAKKAAAPVAPAADPIK
jgi:hypothetical protein